MEQINDALELFETLQNDSSVSAHIVTSVEAFLTTPLTPLARSWDSFAGDYFTNAVGNGMFYAILAWTVFYNLYTKFMDIALRRAPWTGPRGFQIVDAMWYAVVHTILLLISLGMVDTGYVLDVIRLDVWSFSWRMLLHSVRVVPRSVMIVFVACSAFQIFSALQDIVQDKNKSAVRKTSMAVSFVVMYCFRKIQLLLLANASVCIYGAVCEALQVYHAMTVPTTIRKKVTKISGKKVMKRMTAAPLKELSAKYSTHLSSNKQQLQTLYDTVKGALILKRSIRRHQERKKQAQSSQSEENEQTVTITDISDEILDEITNKLPIVEFPEEPNDVIQTSP